jgi:hypothetical protein
MPLLPVLTWKQCGPEPIKGLVRRLADGNARADNNAIRDRRKPRGSPCSISDRVEGWGAACSGVGSIMYVRTGGRNGSVRARR